MPLYVTEFGWTTHPAGALNYAPEDKRGGYIDATVAALGHTDCGIAAALLYTWITPGGDAGDPQDWYGLRVGGLGGSPVVDQMVDHSQTDARGVRRGGPAGRGDGSGGARLRVDGTAPAYRGEARSTRRARIAGRSFHSTTLGFAEADD